MNIFVVDEDPRVAARSLCDQHVVKMPTETAQIMNNVLIAYGLDRIMEPFNPKHPAPIWAAESDDNFFWLTIHGIELCAEYGRRYGRVHTSLRKINKAFEIYCVEFFGREISPARISSKPEAFRYIGPAQYKADSPVLSYRNFYNLEKSTFARWRYSKPPEWYTGENH